MQLQQTFEIPSRAERVWAWFKDVEAVVQCLPGASLRAPPDAGALQLAMLVKLGPITANFVGEGAATFDDASHSGSVEGAATDRKSASRIKGQVNFALTEVAGALAPATRVMLTIDYTMGGTLAQFSREGIVRDLAQRLTDTFASNLRHKLEMSGDATAEPDAGAAKVGPPLTAQPTAQAAAPAVQPADEKPASVGASGGDGREATKPLPKSPSAGNAAAPAAPLNFGALLWSVIVGRVRRWLGPRRPR